MNMTATDEQIKFLLVDDLEGNLLALEAVLRRDGLTFHKATSGEAALELMLVNDYALALLDVQMPGMSGFELAEIMRANERSRHIPIIFVTAGTSDPERQFKGYEAGAVDFIQKPIKPAILKSKTDVFFDLYRQRLEIAAQRDELDAMSRSLQAADAQKNRFLAVLAHELRNPIMALMSGLRLLERHDGTDMASQIRGAMNRSLGYMIRLVDDLLDIARIEQGKILLQKEETSLQNAVTVALEMMKPGIDSAGHRLTLTMPIEPIRLVADPARITQIVVNLVGNATKYTPAGGEISLEAFERENTAYIRVGDSGIGIPEDQHDSVFNIFQQVALKDNAKQDGLGIGLALVRHLCELHGGAIDLVHSNPNQGSLFEVRLPIAQPAKLFSNFSEFGTGSADRAPAI
jgi:signal transduction histidine kinase